MDFNSQQIAPSFIYENMANFGDRQLASLLANLTPTPNVSGQWALTFTYSGVFPVEPTIRPWRKIILDMLFNAGAMTGPLFPLVNASTAVIFAGSHGAPIGDTTTDIVKSYYIPQLPAVGTYITSIVASTDKGIQANFSQVAVSTSLEATALKLGETPVFGTFLAYKI